MVERWVAFVGVNLLPSSMVDIQTMLVSRTAGQSHSLWDGKNSWCVRTNGMSLNKKQKCNALFITVVTIKWTKKCFCTGLFSMT